MISVCARYQCEMVLKHAQQHALVSDLLQATWSRASTCIRPVRSAVPRAAAYKAVCCNCCCRRGTRDAARFQLALRHGCQLHINLVALGSQPVRVWRCGFVGWGHRYGACVHTSPAVYSGLHTNQMLPLSTSTQTPNHADARCTGRRHVLCRFLTHSQVKLAGLLVRVDASDGQAAAFDPVGGEIMRCVARPVVAECGLNLC